MRYKNRIRKILALRAQGLTWNEIDQTLFRNPDWKSYWIIRLAR